MNLQSKYAEGGMQAKEPKKKFMFMGYGAYGPRGGPSIFDGGGMIRSPRYFDAIFEKLGLLKKPRHRSEGEE